MLTRFADTCRSVIAVVMFGTLMSGCSVFKPAPEIVDTDPSKQPLPPELISGYNEGLELLEDQEYDAALTHWKALSETYAQYPGVLVNLAISQYRLEQFEHGLESVTAAQAINTEFCPSHKVRALIERELGQFREAEKSYLSAIQCEPDNLDVKYNLGILYDLYLHDLPKALEQYALVQKGTTETDEKLAMWITDLERRAGAEQVAGDGS